MSSSSSDSDSDDIEPIRRIKINIKPKDNVAKKDGADVEAIKASVEAWRPLGPRPHPSLTRRQSSLSSVSSLSVGLGGSAHGGSNSTTATSNSVTSATFGNPNHQYQHYQYNHLGGNGADTAANAGFVASSGTIGTNIRGNTMATGTTMMASTHNFMRSSPSCSSLVNEFNNRSSFSDFISNASRTSSPLTLMGGVNGAIGTGITGSHSENTVPIAIAIQESIELTVKGQQGGQQSCGENKTLFETRALGNIKVAFPNSFARRCSTANEAGSSDKPVPALKLRLHSTDNIIRYYASGLVRDLDSESSSLSDTFNNNINSNINNINSNASLENSCSTSTNGSDHQGDEANYNLFDMNESPTNKKGHSKIIEFDMDALIEQLKRQYDQAQNSRYYNVDVLRYQIAPLDQFEKCPLQACAYWKVEQKLIKLRVDFKHSNQSGLSLERLREISFNADLSNLVPSDLNIQPVPPNLVSSLATPKTTPQPTTSSIMDNGMVQDGFKSITSNSSDSSLLSDHTRNWLTNTQGTAVSAKSLGQPTASFLDQTSSSSIQMAFATTPPQPAPRQINQLNSNRTASAIQIKLPPPPSSTHSRNHHNTHSRASNLSNQMTGMETLRKQPSPLLRNQSNSSSGRSDVQSLVSGHSQSNETSILDQIMSLDQPSNSNDTAPSLSQASLNLSNTGSMTSPTVAANNAIPLVPYITFEPRAHWNNETKQLSWRFDNLLSFYKSDGYGSLLAKLDFRNSDLAPTAASGFQDNQQPQPMPNPIDIKFMVVDSTLSKVSLSIDSTGYRMSLLKREVRSGRYKSEPNTF